MIIEDSIGGITTGKFEIYAKESGKVKSTIDLVDKLLKDKMISDGLAIPMTADQDFFVTAVSCGEDGSYGVRVKSKVHGEESNTKYYRVDRNGVSNVEKSEYDDLVRKYKDTSYRKETEDIEYNIKAKETEGSKYYLEDKDNCISKIKDESWLVINKGIFSNMKHWLHEIRVFAHNLIHNIIDGIGITSTRDRLGKLKRFLTNETHVSGIVGRNEDMYEPIENFYGNKNIEEISQVGAKDKLEDTLENVNDNDNDKVGMLK